LIVFFSKDAANPDDEAVTLMRKALEDLRAIRLRLVQEDNRTQVVRHVSQFIGKPFPLKEFCNALKPFLSVIPTVRFDATDGDES
jgi:hypothetical protein